ncbi:hypothetical protein C8R45DRAFT_1070665 [Mycena sanguinolenta]|nr:hypothetical protein C8R45DRAFT_1070665 [Mycena sanguinolenta]
MPKSRANWASRLSVAFGSYLPPKKSWSRKFELVSVPSEISLPIIRHQSPAVYHSGFSMTTVPSFMRDVLLEQKERTRGSSRADVRRFIEQSEMKIISLESQINTLVERRDRERNCLAALRHLNSPIQILPVELLAEIFELAIRNQQPTWRYIKDLLQISQICSDWRQVAHSTPRLWSRPMEIDLRPRRRSDREQVHADVEWEIKNRRIPDEILRTASRWRSLYFPKMTSLPIVSQLAKTGLDNLEALDLGEVDFPESDPPLSFTTSTVPRLRKLHMGIYSDVLPILVPWAQLTHLILRTRFPDITLDILDECVDLLHADVYTPVSDGYLEDVDDISALSHLHTLSIHFLEAEGEVLRFLNYFSAPVLEEIFLDFGHVRRQVWTEADFTKFQSRSPNITQLGLKFCYVASNELMTAMKLTHCDYCFDDALIDALRYKAGAIPLAPHLHNLFLEDIGNNFTEEKLAGMIASRWWNDAELGSRSVPAPVARWTRVQLPLLQNKCATKSVKFVGRIVKRTGILNWRG